MAVIIEHLERSNKVIHREKISSHDLSIGRDYQNDVQTSDLYVCAEHVRIEEKDNQWFITDLNTINGSKLNNKKFNNSMPIKSGDVIRIGQTRLRFILPHHPVGPTLSFNAFSHILNSFKHPLFIGICLLISSLFSIDDLTSSTAEVIETVKIMEFTFMSLLAVICWPLLYSFIARLFGGEPRLLKHIGFALLVSSMIGGYAYLSKLLQFNHYQLSSFINYGFYLSLALCALIIHSFISYQQTLSKRVFIASSVLIFSFGGYILFNNSNSDKFSHQANYNSLLMHQNNYIYQPIDIDSFILNAENNFRRHNEQNLR